MTPREVFDKLKDNYLDETLDGELLADQIVVEVPFAPPGRGKRFEGSREEFVARINAERAAFPFRLDRVSVDAVHESSDPEVVIGQFRLGGALPSGEVREASFVVVLRVRDGKIVLWREYQDTLALIEAMTRP